MYKVPVSGQRTSSCPSSACTFKHSSAIEAGFTVGTVKAGVDSRLLVMDVVRTATVVRSDVSEVWGCGFRFLVEISDIKLAAKLTLPAIAGSAETTQLQADIRLEVKGYLGNDLWSLLPVPKPLTVDSYRDYMAAVEKIQAHPCARARA